jgi:uncharacterized protein (TIGR03083 family)
MLSWGNTRQIHHSYLKDGKLMKPVEPIHVLELFPPLSRELLSVLKALEPVDWRRPTICAGWCVKDVAAHLLGGNLGRLRQHAGTATPSDEKQSMDYDELLSLINDDNELWVRAAQRISPELLVELLELTDGHLYDTFSRLDPDALAPITVAWASDSLPPNWLDIAREYTEKWLHQQHIREAVNRPLLTGRTWLSPVLDTFMRGLPRTFRNMDARQDTSITVQITGEAGAEWCLVREDSNWQLYLGGNPQAITRVQMDQDLAWRLFTRGVPPQDARRQVQIEGDVRVGEKVLEMVSIMA